MADSFVTACSELGVTKILLIRHANSNPIKGDNRSSSTPHDWKFRDQTRTLSALGKEQCSISREYLRGISIKANLVSPARRATDTAALMTMDPNGGDIFLRMIEGLHPAGMSAVCEDLFDELGYGPVRYTTYEYFK